MEQPRSSSVVLNPQQEHQHAQQQPTYIVLQQHGGHATYLPSAPDKELLAFKPSQVGGGNNGFHLPTNVIAPMPITKTPLPIIGGKFRIEDAR